jgi:hypothetical protein
MTGGLVSRAVVGTRPKGSSINKSAATPTEQNHNLEDWLHLRIFTVRTYEWRHGGPDDATVGELRLSNSMGELSDLPPSRLRSRENFSMIGVLPAAVVPKEASALRSARATTCPKQMSPRCDHTVCLLELDFVAGKRGDMALWNVLRTYLRPPLGGDGARLSASAAPMGPFPSVATSECVTSPLPGK